MAANLSNPSTLSADQFLSWAHDSQKSIDSIAYLSQAMRWSVILRGTPACPRNREVVDEVIRVLSSGHSEDQSDPEVSAIISQLEATGCSRNNIKTLLEIPAKFARFGKTAPLLIADYEKEDMKMKYVIKFTDYREFLAQRVYHVFLKHCPPMQASNMHVCRTAAIANFVGVPPRYSIDELPPAGQEDGCLLDESGAKKCQGSVSNMLSPVQQVNWNKLSGPVILISEKVDGITLRELVIDGRFESLEERQKLELCTQLGMSAALDLVFGNHDRIIHDSCSNLGNVMLTIDKDGSIHCWLIDNGDVPPKFGEDLSIKRAMIVSEEEVQRKMIRSLEGVRPRQNWESEEYIGDPQQRIQQQLEDKRFSDFADYMQTHEAKEAIRQGIAGMSAFLAGQSNDPGSELNLELKRLSNCRLSIPEASVSEVKPVGKFVPRFRRQNLEG